MIRSPSKFKFYRRYRSDVWGKLLARRLPLEAESILGDVGSDVAKRHEVVHLFRRLASDRLRLRLVYSRLFSSLRQFNNFKRRRRPTLYGSFRASKMKAGAYFSLRHGALRRWFSRYFLHRRWENGSLVSTLERRPDLLAIRLGLSVSVPFARLLSLGGYLSCEGVLVTRVAAPLPVGSGFIFTPRTWAGFFALCQWRFRRRSRGLSFQPVPPFLDYQAPMGWFRILMDPKPWHVRYPFRLRLDKVFAFYGFTGGF